MINKLIRKIRNKIAVFKSNSGSLKKYYKLCAEHEKLMLSDAELAVKNKSFVKVSNYADRVSGKPFINEKKREKGLIWNYINEDKLPEKYANEVAYLKTKGELELFPYDFKDKYNYSQFELLLDDKCNLNYVIHKGRRLYFKDNNEDNNKDVYLQLLIEQDKESPHQYFPEGIMECDVFIDVGAAEGIIALELLDTAKEIYLLECSDEWINALEKTFCDYMDKVHIVKKYAGSYDEGDTITIDSLLKKYNNKKVYIKMDIEGMEIEALRGCKDVMKNNDCYFSCASYHTNTAFEELREFFENQNYFCKSIDKYMLFLFGYMTLHNGKYQQMEYPFFRHGLIEANKKLEKE